MKYLKNGKTGAALLLLLLVLCLCGAACAEEGSCGEAVTWKLEEGVLTVSGTGKINFAPWWENETLRKGIRKVVIGDGVIAIAPYIFDECLRLEEAVIADSVTDIGDHAFYHCYGLRTVRLPEGLVRIGDCAFQYAAFETVTIPDSVTDIGADVFAGCRYLKEIAVSAGNRSFCSADGVLFSRDMTRLRACPAAKEGSYAVPDGVTVIEEGAFTNCAGLTAVTFPDSLTGIRGTAFYDCRGLTEVVIPEGVMTIGERAFFGCENLAKVSIPDSVARIGDGAFLSCGSLAEFEVSGENCVYESRDGLLLNRTESSLVYCPCGREGVCAIPEGVNAVGSWAFGYCEKLTGVIIPESVSWIGWRAFAWTRDLAEITVAEGNPFFCSEDGVLYNKDKTCLVACPAGKQGVLTVPDSVTEIGDDAFQHCAGVEVVLTDRIERIGKSAFFDSRARVTAPAGSWAAEWLQENRESNSYKLTIR